MAVYANRTQNRELNSKGDDSSVKVLVEPDLPMGSRPGSKSNSNGYQDIANNNEEQNGIIGKQENFYEIPKETKEEYNLPEIQNTYLTYVKPTTPPSSVPSYSRRAGLIGLLFLLVLIGFSIGLSAWSVSLIKSHIRDFETHIKDIDGRMIPTASTMIGTRKRTIGVDNCLPVDCGFNGSCVISSNGSYVCICDTGYQYNGRNCSDIDECAELERVCDRNAVCINTVGSFECNCTTGYHGDGLQCSDIDECRTMSDNCDTNAICINTVGSFYCRCENGYVGTGQQCTDIDECRTMSDNCDTNAICINTVGSFYCRCENGYVGTGQQCTESECTYSALGMESGSISDSAITASHQRFGYEAHRGRLNDERSWWPGFDSEFVNTNVWIQVDLQRSVDVVGIKTQGDGGNEFSVDYVTQLKIQYGDNTNALMTIEDGDGIKIFEANSDATNVKTISFPEPIRTRYIRVIPTGHAEGGTGQRVFQMRMEILGCS